MPWHTDADARRHKMGMTSAQCALWRRVANRVLAKTGDEGRAIRIANIAVNNSGRKAKRKLSSVKKKR